MNRYRLITNRWFVWLERRNIAPFFFCDTSSESDKIVSDRN